MLRHSSRFDKLAILLSTTVLVVSLSMLGHPHRAEADIVQGKGKCVPDQKNTNACNPGGQSTCPDPPQAGDRYCPNAQTPSLCDDTSTDPCYLSQNVFCGHQFSCVTLQIVEPQVDCGGGQPDACAKAPPPSEP